MPSFSQRSKDKLATCHKDLQRLMNEVIKDVDITIVCGFRGEAEQNDAFERGASLKKFPNSKHNKLPSVAVDVVPYPVDWSNIDAFKDLAVVIDRKAAELGIKVKWGGRWTTFKDYPHWELV